MITRHYNHISLKEKEEEEGEEEERRRKKKEERRRKNGNWPGWLTPHLMDFG